MKYTKEDLENYKESVDKLQNRCKEVFIIKAGQYQMRTKDFDNDYYIDDDEVRFTYYDRYSESCSDGFPISYLTMSDEDIIAKINYDKQLVRLQREQKELAKIEDERLDKIKRENNRYNLYLELKKEYE